MLGCGSLAFGLYSGSWYCGQVNYAQLHTTLCDTLDCVACQVPLSMKFSRQEYWSRLPFTSPGDLPDPGIEPGSPTQVADS